MSPSPPKDAGRVVRDVWTRADDTWHAHAPRVARAYAGDTVTDAPPLITATEHGSWIFMGYLVDEVTPGNFGSFFLTTVERSWSFLNFLRSFICIDDRY